MLILYIKLHLNHSHGVFMSAFKTSQQQPINLLHELFSVSFLIAK